MSEKVLHNISGFNDYRFYSVCFGVSLGHMARSAWNNRV